MTAIVPQSDVFPEATVRRLVDDLLAALEAIPDHRDRRGRVYPLASLLAIHVLAAVGDANSPEDAADFARDHAAWLRGLGLLGDRVPSAQTLRRLLRDRGSDLLAELQPLVMRLATACEAAAEEEKKPGRERTRTRRKRSRWRPAPSTASRCAVRATRPAACAARTSSRRGWDGGLTIGQAAVPTKGKGNELTAIRQLLPALDLEDRVVSIDAMGCRTDVAGTIADADGWYLLAVTDGEANLHANLQRDFAYLDRTGAVAHDRHETVERGHGRTERRTCTHPGRRPRHPGRNRSRPALGRAGLRRAHGRRTHRARPHDLRRALLHLQPARGHRGRPHGQLRARALAGTLWVREQPALGAGRHLPGGPLPPAHRPRRPQHGRPATRRPEHAYPPAAVFLAKVVNSPFAQDGGPQPRPAGAAHGPVTTLSTPCLFPVLENRLGDPAGQGPCLDVARTG